MKERTDIPLAHAEALLNVCAGRVTYERSAVPIDGGAEVLIDRMSEPGVINTVTVEFQYPEEAEAFTPLTWFGPEITSEARFGGQMIAMNGPPQVEEVPLSNTPWRLCSTFLKVDIPPLSLSLRPLHVRP